jgi:hypothetical protein
MKPPKGMIVPSESAFFQGVVLFYREKPHFGGSFLGAVIQELLTSLPRTKVLSWNCHILPPLKETKSPS